MTIFMLKKIYTWVSATLVSANTGSRQTDVSFSHSHEVNVTLHYDKTSSTPGTLTGLTCLSDKWKAFKASRCTVALGATCSYVCPVPGRLHTASSYSGARKSRRYRVGDPRTRSRDRFTLKAMAKGGAFMRREKKRSIKEGRAVNLERQKSNILPKIFAKHFEGKWITKERWKATQMEGMGGMGLPE